MAWVKFTADFEYRQPSHSIDYKTGWSGSVKAHCADMAVAAGKAERLKTPRKGEAQEPGAADEAAP